MLSLSCIYLSWSLAAKLGVDRKVELEAREKFGSDISYVSLAAPFTTLLWRVVVMDESHYHVTYVSMFNFGKPLSFNSFANNHAIAAQVPPEYLQKIQWFTHGFYKLQEKDQQIIATDLRMGLEDAYVFNFVLARREKDEETATPLPYQLEREFDLAKLRAVYDHF